MYALQSMRSWAAVALLSGGLALLTVGTAAGQIFEQDHLKCYKVTKDENKGGTHAVDLLNRQFGPETGCKVSNKAAYLCTPTAKVNVDGTPAGDDPRGFAIDNITDDYLCYRMRCPNAQERTVLIDDQFNRRHLRIKPAQLLCTPARKIEPPPNIECQDSGPPLCGGFCPSPLTCRQSTAGAGCACAP